jgi:acyl carrier protein
MRKLLLSALSLFLFVACVQKSNNKTLEEEIEAETTDSTIYGVCGEGTMMHTLELITNIEDTLTLFINDEDADHLTTVSGGLMCGDRMAVTAYKSQDGLTANRIINITSLIGKWSSIDKSFELTDDGEVKSSMKVENGAWTAWRILNGHLLLNRDTFDIVTLGADSLELENTKGIYAFKRVHEALVPDSVKVTTNKKH